MDTQLDIFGSRNCEYLIILEPDLETIQQVIDFRKKLSMLTNISTDSFHSKPHISLCYFETTDYSEELIIEKIKSLAPEISPFRVFIDGCEKWKNGTLILKVSRDPKIDQLQNTLSTIFKGTIKTPHLTISRNIPGSVLESLSSADFEYTGSFICSSLLLLKKHGDDPYQILERVQFSVY